VLHTRKYMFLIVAIALLGCGATYYYALRQPPTLSCLDQTRAESGGAQSACSVVAGDHRPESHPDLS
jgi:hypothetical protein